MKKSVLLIIALILLSVFTSCKNQKETVTPEELCFDIQRIQIDISHSAMKSLYNPEPFEQLKQDVMDGKVDRLECIFRLQKIINNYHVAHLALSQQPKDQTAQILMPLQFYSFEDGYRVFITDKKYAKYLGWKLKEMAGLPVEQARDKIVDYYSYETPSAANRLLERELNFYQLKHAGLLDKRGRLKVVLESPDGKLKAISFKKITSSKMKRFYLYPEKGLPYHPYAVNKNYGILSCKERRTLYIPYKSCFGIPEYPITELFSDMKKELQTGLYDTVVFDIRYNGGGMPREAIVFRHLFYDNREEFNKCNLAIVTSGWTFSAATWFLNDFLDVFPKTVIFGEETGQAVFNYTYVMPYALRKLNCQFIFPQVLDDNPVLRVRAQDIYRGTMPDVEVHERYEDYMNGEDTIYNAIYEYFQK